MSYMDFREHYPNICLRNRLCLKHGCLMCMSQPSVTLCMWLIFSSLGRCLWILRISHVHWVGDTLLSLLPYEKGQAWVKSANKTSTGPCGSRHTPLHFLWLNAWPLLIPPNPHPNSHLALQPFMTLPCVIIAPRWDHASLERKRKGKTDNKSDGERKTEQRWDRDERSLVLFFFSATCFAVFNNIHAV